MGGIRDTKWGVEALALELGWCIGIWLGLGKFVGRSPGVLYAMSSTHWFLLGYLLEVSITL